MLLSMSNSLSAEIVCNSANFPWLRASVVRYSRRLVPFDARERLNAPAHALKRRMRDLSARRVEFGGDERGDEFGAHPSTRERKLGRSVAPFCNSRRKFPPGWSTMPRSASSAARIFDGLSAKNGAWGANAIAPVATFLASKRTVRTRCGDVHEAIAVEANRLERYCRQCPSGPHTNPDSPSACRFA